MLYNFEHYFKSTLLLSIFKFQRDVQEKRKIFIENAGEKLASEIDAL